MHFLEAHTYFLPEMQEPELGLQKVTEKVDQEVKYILLDK